MAEITINEGLAWLKTLKKRHEGLLALRNDNAHRERRFYGADKEIVKEPVYDVKVLDRVVTRDRAGQSLWGGPEGRVISRRQVRSRRNFSIAFVNDRPAASCRPARRRPSPGAA